MGSQVVEDALDVDLSHLESPLYSVPTLDFYLFLATKKLDTFKQTEPFFLAALQFLSQA